jgi:dGTPase
VVGEFAGHVAAAVGGTSLAGMTELAGRVADAFEARVREQEERSLSPLAVRSYETRGRQREEEPCRLRTPFQRDRDRIVHSKAFRRLRNKTQVFIDPGGDHFRTRITHTIETTGISRGVARALGLNEDLVEAIGLGHDLGHTPFGHTGEEELDRQLRDRFGLHFRHNEHSLRIVDVLEKEGQGLNLTHEVRDGILNHTGATEPETLEGRIVRIVDRVAYINHDIDDALRAGVLSHDELPRAELKLLGETGSRRIDALVHDLVETSEREGDIRQSEEVGTAMLALRTFMFERVYLGPHTEAQHNQARDVVGRVFAHLVENPDRVPSGPGDLGQRIADYVAGMTDRFALAYADRL